MKSLRIIRKNKGFTLIELLLVMAIMGILITMISGSFMTSIRRGRDSRRKSDLSQVSKALELYYSDFGRYPLSAGGVINGCGSGGTSACAWGNIFSATSATGSVTYMVQLPDDPGSSRNYFYATDAGGTNYQLYASIEHNQDPDILTGSQTYQGTNCGVGECNYGIASVNSLPGDNGHVAH
jgi:type II secretion system protein G